MYKIGHKKWHMGYEVTVITKSYTLPYGGLYQDAVRDDGKVVIIRLDSEQDLYK